MKKITRPMIVSCVAIGMAGFWLWYFLLIEFQEDFYTFLGVPTLFLVLFGTAIVGGITSYIIGRRTFNGDLTRSSAVTSFVVGLIVAALAFCIWFPAIPVLVGQ